MANDWDTELQLRWATFYSILHFRQLPLWNPYRCGGMPLLGHPQSALVSPFLALDLLMGPLAGTHLQVVIHLAIAFGGGCFLARALGISRLGAIASAACFAGSSWYYLHLAAGHACFMPYTYAPWTIGFFYLSIRDRRMMFAAIAGLTLAMMFLQGGHYEVPQTGLILALMAVTIALQKRSLAPLMMLAACALWTVGFAAIKLLPTLEFFGPGGRRIDPGEANQFSMIVRELFSRNQWGGQVFKGYPWGFHEYGAYVGMIFGALGVWGVARDVRRALPWLVICLATLMLALGYFGPYSPWVIIHKLSPFYSERIPSRFLILFTLSIGVLAGFGIDNLRSASPPWSAAFAAVLVAVALIDSWNVSSSYLYAVVAGGQSPLPWHPTFTQSSEPRMGGHAMFMASNANLGAIACNDSIPHKFNVHGFEDGDYRGEQYLLGSGSVTLTRWTPNALDFEVNAPTPTVLVVNQNYDANWSLSAGRGELFSSDGLIAMHVPAGHQQVDLAFRSHAFEVGLLLTTLTFIAMIVLIVAAAEPFALAAWLQSFRSPGLDVSMRSR